MSTGLIVFLWMLTIIVAGFFFTYICECLAGLEKQTKRIADSMEKEAEAETEILRGGNFG